MALDERVYELPKERVRAVKDREGRERDEEDGEEEQADRWANVWESGFAWDGGVGPRDKAVRCCGWAANNEEGEGKE